MKLSVLGASSVATLQLAGQLTSLDASLLQRNDFRLRLYARSQERLAPIASDVIRRAEGLFPVTHTTSLEEALRGADLVLLQVRIGGLEARRFDESFPHRVGLPGEETLGPGGFANALRTVPALEETFEEIARVSPNALVVVLTNPAGILRRAATRHGLNAIEVCESPHVLLATIGERLGRSPLELQSRYVGMNHVGFYVPENEEQLTQLLDVVPVDEESIRFFGAVPLGYVRYYADPKRYFEAQLDKPTRAEELMKVDQASRELLGHGDAPDPSSRPAPWYSLAFLPVVRSLLGEGAPLLAGTPNAQRISQLSDDATIEGPATIDDEGRVSSRDVVALPDGARDLLARHAKYEDLALRACLDPTNDNVAAALRANPMVSDDNDVSELIEVLVSSPFGLGQDRGAS